VAMVTLVCITLIVTSTWTGINAWRIHVEMQVLALADDASTPEQKAIYIGKFLANMNVEELPEYGNFLFTHEGNRVSSQITVLQSLKKRCDDLAVVDPSELGYAQGMTQITGQEFEHALIKVGGVFQGAMWVKVGWWACYGWLIMLAATIAAIILATIIWDKEPSPNRPNSHRYR